MIQWKKVFVSSRFLFDFIHLCNSNIGKTAWNQSYCIYHLWDNKHAHWASAALCVDWIRSKISRCDQGRDRVRLKDLRLHLPMNIWCLSEARASDPLSGHWGVGGNLPYLHLATFQQFLMRMFPHSCCAKELCSSCLHQIKIVPLILNHCRLVFFSLPRLSQNTVIHTSFKKQTLFHTVRLPIPADTEQLFGSELASESLSAQLDVGCSQQIKISSWQSQANQVVKWPQSYFDTQAAT